MKFRSMRDVYWLEASTSTTKIIENVTPTTFIIEPAIVDIIPRAPSAPAPNRRGHRFSQRSLPAESASIKATAKAMLTTTISKGRSQRLDRRLLQSCLSLFMGQIPLPVSGFGQVFGMLGIFAGVFSYSLIVLRTIRSGDEGAFVPSLAASFGFVLALGGVGALMFFIHHIASSIQASSIIASIAQETIGAIDRLFPEQLGQEPGEDDDEQPLGPLAERKWRAVQTRRSGYIQNVNNAALLRLARDRNTIVRMEHGIGEFVVQNTPLASLALEHPPDQETTAALQATFSISRHRMVEQDAAFGIRQIVDVVLKALSPGINDTTTAVTCVDYLTVILARLAPRPILSSRCYEEGELRVIAKCPSFKNLLAESFDQIRRNAKGDVAIMSRMLDALQTIAILTASLHRRRAIGEQVQWIAELAERTVESAHDRARIETRLAHVRETLEAERALCPREERE